jgi:hypothetical protein
MLKWTLACGAVVTLAGFLAVPAQAQQAVQPTTPPVTVIQTPTTQTPRFGLLRRFRERRGMTPATTVSQPVTQLKTMPSATGKVQQAGATEVVPAPTTQVVEGRQGLLSRLRGRLGR